MSESQKVSNFTDYVRENIERCIQKYMSLEQTMTYLHDNHQIYHPITRTIWEHLQRDNPNFFKHYYKRCEVARQIAKFNDLLIRQRDLIQKFKEIDLTTTLHPTQLQHQQDQLHDQCFSLNDFAYSLVDPSLSVAATPPPPQSDSSSTSGFGYDTGLEDVDFEQFFRELEEQQQRLQLHIQRQQQPPPPQQQPYYPLEFEASNNLDNGDGSTNNNGSDPPHDLRGEHQQVKQQKKLAKQ